MTDTLQPTTSPSEEAVDLHDFFVNACSFFKLLSNLFYVELTEDQIDALAQGAFDYPDDGSNMGRACKQIRTYLKRRGDNARQDLAVDYARVFLAAGIYEGETAVPYESVYTSDDGILMQDSRDDVVRIYHENDLVIPQSLQVPEDHLSFELEFLSQLSERIACALAEGKPTDMLMETQLSFIDNHLLNWIDQLQARVKNYAELPFYPAMLEVCKCFALETRDVLAESMS